VLPFGYRSGESRLPSNPRGVWLGEADIVTLLSSRPGVAHPLGRHFLFSVMVVLALLSPSSAAASTPPPIGENAYCGKGDVPKFGDKDGPAQLPTSCYYTAMDGTPSPGKQIRVAANSDLPAAVESAKCGDTLLLAAGASFDIKDLPAKKCDDQHYLTIRTDTSDAKLPPEGTRVSPAWSGVATLPGRPAFAQPPGGPAKLLATLIVKTPTHLGDHYRFIGLEWTPDPGVRVGALVTTEGADHIVFDRNWFHPAEGAEMGRDQFLSQRILLRGAYWRLHRRLGRGRRIRRTPHEHAEDLQ
jgi:hypothetical protein